MNELFSPSMTPIAGQTEEFCAGHAEAIRVLGKRVARDIIEIGQRLTLVKGALTHGLWLPWIKREFGWVSQTADNFMHVANCFGPIKFPSLGNLDLTIDAWALYTLSAPSVPEPARIEAIAAVEQGEHVTKADADRMIRDAREAETDRQQTIMRGVIAAQEAQQALQVSELLEKAEAAWLADQGSVTDDRKALMAEIERIKAKPAQTPNLASIITDMCRELKQKKLNDKQYRALAQTLGQSISDGKQVYQPISDDVMQKNEEHLRIASRITDALVALAGAPSPDMMREVTTGPIRVLRRLHREHISAVAQWCSAYQIVLQQGDENNDETE